MSDLAVSGDGHHDSYGLGIITNDIRFEKSLGAIGWPVGV
jgi:hypothetical protein